MIQLSTSLLYIINKENTSTNIHSPLQTTIKMSLFATNTSTFSNVHHKTGCWIRQDLLEIHTAITDGDFRKAGILIGEKGELNRTYEDNTTILMQLCQTIRKNEESNAISLVKVLLDKGARVDIKDVHGKTAADYAKRNGLKLIIMPFHAICSENLLSENCF